MQSQTENTSEQAAVDLAKIKVARRAGDWLGVFDAAETAIRAGRGGEEMHYNQALALANIGDIERASFLFDTCRLADNADTHKRALGARLLKDQGRTKEAYASYRALYDKTHDPYHGINAASLALLSDQCDDAREVATSILALPNIAAPSDYYSAATKAEALVILGDAKGAAAAIALATSLPDSGPGPQSGTLRQLSRVAPAAGIAPHDCCALLDMLRPPACFHYAGHMFAPEPTEEARISHAIHEALNDHKAGYAFGSLAAGADILVAEAVLERGGELHIVLPCAWSDFVAQSVRPAGEEWVTRAEACKARVADNRIIFASTIEYVSDPEIFAYGSAVAMGLARLKAQQLAAHCFQIAIWDGKPGGRVGTGSDIALWRARGGNTEVINSGAIDRGFARPEGAEEQSLPRRNAAILFTDYAGFSQLAESRYPVFDGEIMGRVAAVVDRHGSRVLGRNTWGDALFAVLDNAIAGAEFALDLQHELKDFDPAALGLEEGRGGMRIALHYGSVYEAADRVTGMANFLGNEIARAARIEPITPPGDVYVTEPFAAMIALHAHERFRCRYVGKVDLAKKYGAFPMYRLTPAAPGGASDA
ncbi:hypothetical protein [Blastomonas sp.]|uniref:adenylate/guanylate cyclase domain-containing protein n=1 Tax=Blastomonas sp. TaxID=1909299 RepID=UPI0035946D36